MTLDIQSALEALRSGEEAVRRATVKPRDLEVPPPTTRPTDSLSLLLRDRSSR